MVCIFQGKNIDKRWLERHHVPFKDIADDISFYCLGPKCHHKYSAYLAIHIGFHCHSCHRLLHIVDVY